MCQYCEDYACFLVISMFMIGKKGFSVTVVNIGFTENVLNWLNKNIRNYKLIKKRFGTVGCAQKTYSDSMKSIIHNDIRFWFRVEGLKTISTKIITEIKSKIKTTTCNVCNKKNKITKGVSCKTCIYPLHRKCCKLKLTDIHDIRKDKWV